MVGQFETLVNPQRPIPPKVIQITGITPRMVAGAPRIEEVLPHLLDFLRDAVIVAHNALFDVSFLNYELTRLEGPAPGRRRHRHACSWPGLLAPGLPNYRLGTVADALGSPVAPATGRSPMLRPRPTSSSPWWDVCRSEASPA